MSNIDATLQERGSRYGDFTGHAEITQSIKDAMVDSANWEHLEDDQKEALEMVAHKIGRILNGDPQYIDSWTDIIGYTRLVEKRLIAEQESAKGLMEEKCDDAHCPGCYPENRVSLGEMLEAALRDAGPKPKDVDSDIANALKVLLDAGIVKAA